MAHLMDIRFCFFFFSKKKNMKYDWNRKRRKKSDGKETKSKFIKSYLYSRQSTIVCMCARGKWFISSVCAFVLCLVCACLLFVHCWKFINSVQLFIVFFSRHHWYSVLIDGFMYCYRYYYGSLPLLCFSLPHKVQFCYIVSWVFFNFILMRKRTNLVVLFIWSENISNLYNCDTEIIDIQKLLQF